NKNISILRKTLGQWDGAREYIETVPKRGYRFTAAVNELAAKEETNSIPELPTLVNKAPPGTRMLREKWPRGIFLALIVILAGSTALKFRFTRPVSFPRVVNVAQITEDRVPKLDLLTDGSRIYINETLGLKQILVQSAVTGGETSVIPTPFASITI